jgi:hypothetical protein
MHRSCLPRHALLCSIEPNLSSSGGDDEWNGSRRVSAQAEGMVSSRLVHSTRSSITVIKGHGDSLVHLLDNSLTI